MTLLYLLLGTLFGSVATCVALWLPAELQARRAMRAVVGVTRGVTGRDVRRLVASGAISTPRERGRA